MAKISEAMLDLDRVDEGKWFPWVAGINLRICSVNKPAYKQHRDRLLRPHLRDLRAGRLSNEQIIDAVMPAVAQHLLVGWNIEDDDGKAVPYSPEKAMEYMRHPKLPDLCPFVLESAGETDAFRQELLEDAEKN